MLLGDRTGEVQPGIYERVWRELAATQPAFVLSTGDTIQGLNDATAEAEWREARRLRRTLPADSALPRARQSRYLVRRLGAAVPPVRGTRAALQLRFRRRPLHRARTTAARTPGRAGELAWLETDLREHPRHR